LAEQTSMVIIITVMRRAMLAKHPLFREAFPMVSPVRDHYEKLLGPVYSWMVGDIDAAIIRADAELEAIGLHTNGIGIAVDLGAGFGMHSVPLARRGYQVTAVDSYEPLLSELAARAGSLPIRTVNANLLEFKSHVPHPATVILCMGDTLTHLPDAASVEDLFSTAASTLVPGGLFVVTFRDYASAPLEGDGRFILVRSDEDRILTCFLEYGEATVQVHDVLHERDGGQWRLRLSSYPKLRLSPGWVVSTLTSVGFTVRREPGLSGMVRVIAQLGPLMP
jgi:SAM-dependent methyltransferase